MPIFLGVSSLSVSISAESVDMFQNWRFQDESNELNYLKYNTLRSIYQWHKACSLEAKIGRTNYETNRYGY